MPFRFIFNNASREKLQKIDGFTNANFGVSGRGFAELPAKI